MNGFSQIKLRRVPALLLFFLLGPALLLAVLGLVIYRHGGGSRADEEAKLSSLFRVRVEMRGAEFVRPEIQTYFGLTLFSGRVETPFLFCPEILARPLALTGPGPNGSLRSSTNWTPAKAPWRARSTGLADANG